MVRLSQAGFTQIRFSPEKNRSRIQNAAEQDLLQGWQFGANKKMFVCRWRLAEVLVGR
jgi:hypothetical protein